MTRGREGLMGGACWRVATMKRPAGLQILGVRWDCRAGRLEGAMGNTREEPLMAWMMCIRVSDEACGNHEEDSVTVFRADRKEKGDLD